MKTIVDLENDLVKPYIDKEITTRAALGAKNFIPQSVWGITTVFQDITWTVNDDGTVVANGTFGSTYSVSWIGGSFTLPKGSYKLTGTPIGGDVNKYYTRITQGSTILAEDYGNGAEFSLASDASINIYIYVYKTYGTFSNMKFYPMLRLATDTDPTYQPYAMTNRELTEEKYNIKEFFATDIVFANYHNWIETNWSEICKYPMAYIHLSNSDLMILNMPSISQPTLHAAVMVYSRDISTFERGKLSSGTWTWT